MTVAPSFIPQSPPLQLRTFSVDEYHRMIEAGVLTPDDQVELLEGWIAHKMARGSRHDATIELAAAAIQPLLPTGWRIRIQSAITTQDSEPEPDLAIVSGSIREHSQRHPIPDEVALVIEVADSSLLVDRNEKRRVYARGGLAEYWIINLHGRRVEVCAHPSGPSSTPDYGQQRAYGENEAVPLVIGGQEVARLAVRDLLA